MDEATRRGRGRAGAAIGVVGGGESLVFLTLRHVGCVVAAFLVELVASALSGIDPA